MSATGLVLCGMGLLVLPVGSAALRMELLHGKEIPASVLRRLAGVMVRDDGRPALWAAVVGLPLILSGSLSGLCLAAVLMILTWTVVGRLRSRRVRAPTPGDRLRLAGSWDLLAACLRSGMAVAPAVRAVIDGAPPNVSGRLAATADLLDLGADPAEAWAQAKSSPELAEFARAATRTARSGTALAEVASGLADRARSALADEAEARAQRAGVLITCPLGLCFLPAFLCLGVIPVVLGLAQRLSVFP